MEFLNLQNMFMFYVEIDTFGELVFLWFKKDAHFSWWTSSNNYLLWQLFSSFSPGALINQNQNVIVILHQYFKYIWTK